MILVALIAIALTLAHRGVAVPLLLVGAFLVPASVSPDVPSAAVAMSIALFMLTFVLSPKKATAAALSLGGVLYLLAAFALLLLLQDFTGGARSFTSYVVQTIVGPILGFLTIRIHLKLGWVSSESVVRTWSLCAMAAGLTGSIEAILGRPLVYGDALAREYWFSLSSYSRTTGTLDNPLLLGLFLASSMPLASYMKSRWLGLFFWLACLGGIIGSQSRTALIAAAAVSVIHLYLLTKDWRARGAGTLLVAIALVWILQAELVEALFGRFIDDRGSGHTRAIARHVFFGSLGQFIWGGEGAGRSYGWGERQGLYSSLESPLMMWTIDFGALAAATLIVCQVFAVVSHRRRAEAWICGAVCVLVAISFNSQSALDNGSTVVWFILACLGALEGGRILPSAKESQPLDSQT